MTSASMRVVLVCLLILNYKVLGFNIERELYEDGSDSSDDEQQEVHIERQFGQNFPNLNSAYTKDSFNVYFMGKKIDGASAMSFQPLGYGYAKDSWNVYYMGQKISGASAMSFQTLSNGYAKDSWSVYYMGQKMQGVSPNSFSVSNWG